MGFLKMAGANANLILIAVILSSCVWLYREIGKAGKLRGEISVLQIKNENLQTENKTLSAANTALEKQSAAYQKAQKEYSAIKQNNEYLSAFLDTLKNRYEKLYRTYYGKKIDIEKEIKIDVKQPKRGRR